MWNKENSKICGGEVINTNLPKRGENFDWEKTKVTLKKQNYTIDMNLKLNYKQDVLRVSFKVTDLIKSLSSGVKETKTWKIELKDTSGYLNYNSFSVNVNDMLNLKGTFLTKCTINYIEYLEKEEARMYERKQMEIELEELKEKENKANAEAKHQMKRANKMSEKLYETQIELDKREDELANEKEEHNKTKYALITTQKQLASLRTELNNKKQQFTFDMAKEFSLLIVTKGLKKATEVINKKYFN